MKEIMKNKRNRSMNPKIIYAFITILFILISTSFMITNSTKENFQNNIDTETKGKDAAPLLSGWYDSGTEICIAINDQRNSQICSDGAGGAILVWEDERNEPLGGIYAQRINSEGKKQWAENGLEICAKGGYIQICSNDAGGAIIVWQDFSNDNGDICAQRLNSEGKIQWTADGAVICNADDHLAYPHICSDSLGGAIIVWKDERNDGGDIYAQRINSIGVTQWEANGTVISNTFNNQRGPEICNDGAGGAIITWEDYRNGKNDIYAQRINSAGIIQWMENGVAICTKMDSRQPKICNDGAGGAIITWEDLRSGYRHIYSQKISSGGINQWTENGTAICTKSLGERYPLICSDNLGGAIISWRYYYGSEYTYNIEAQRINSIGVTLWDDNGTVISNAPGLQGLDQICSDGYGGAIISWTDGRSGNYDVYAQRISSLGITQWIANGTAVCIKNDYQGGSQICNDGYGGAIITWTDKRSGNSDVYAQRILNNGIIPAIPNMFTLETNADDPDSDGNFTLEWTWSTSAKNYTIYRYNNTIIEINTSLIIVKSGFKENSLSQNFSVNGKYYYVVVAFNDFGNFTSNCIEVQIYIPLPARPPDGGGGSGGDKKKRGEAILGYNIWCIIGILSVIFIVLLKNQKKTIIK